MEFAGKTRTIERVEKAASFILVVGAFFCLSNVIYTLYHFVWIDEADFRSVLGPILYIALPALVAALLLGALRLRAPFRIKLALVVLSTGVSVYGAEGYLTFSDPDSLNAETTLWGIGPDSSAAEIRETIELAKNYGVTFDTRTKGEVIDDLAKKDVHVVPAIYPFSLLEKQADGTNKSAITIGGAEILPLSGISNSKTILCNEEGEHVIYESDEHGFHNPRGIWSVGHFDVAAIGDSFTQGMCVPSGKNFVSIVQKRYPRTLNLGIQGTGPLTQLATLREYLPFVKPNLVFWFYFERNDFDDMRIAMKNPLLRNYLRRGFSQSLFGKQADLDRALTEYIRKIRSGQKLTKKNKAPTGSFRGIVDIEHAINIPERLSDQAISIFKLSSIREKLGWVHGSRRERSSVTPAFPINADIDTLRDVLLEAQAVLGGWGGKLYVVYLPDRDRYAKPATGATFNRDRVLTMLRTTAVPVIDLDNAFRVQADPLALFPFRRFGHYNETGHRLVAEEVLRVICAEELTKRMALPNRTCD